LEKTVLQRAAAESILTGGPGSVSGPLFKSYQIYARDIGGAVREITPVRWILSYGQAW